MTVSGAGHQATVINVDGTFDGWIMGSTSSSSIIGNLRDINITRDTGHRDAGRTYVGLKLQRGGAWGVAPDSIFASTNWEYGHIENCQFVYNGRQVVIGSSSYIVSQPIYFEGCNFGAWDDDCYVCVQQDNACQVRYDNCNFWGFSGDASSGLWSVRDSNDAWVNHCYFATAAYAFDHDPGQNCIKWDRGIVLRVSDCQLENSADAQIRISSCIDAKISNNNMGAFEGGQTEYNIILEPSLGDIRNVRITGNEIGYANSDTSNVLIYKDGSNYKLKDIVIADNNILISGLCGINLIDATNVAITGNTLVEQYGTANSNAILYSCTADYRGANLVISGNSIDMTGASGDWHGIKKNGGSAYGARDIVGNAVYTGAGGDPIDPDGDSADQVEAHNWKA